MNRAIRKKPNSPAAAPPWTELPGDITANILQRVMHAADKLESAQKVCTTWRSVCKEPSVWRRIHLTSDDEEMMCRHAVDRSQGKLVELSLSGFGMGSVLHYAPQRSSQLQCLSLRCCYELTVERLVEAIKRLPLLETLCLSYNLRIVYETIELVGRSCPMLKSFTYEKPRLCGRSQEEFDTEAVAIAKSMPELRHLGLYGNLMTNEGLAAILDGCPRLESLALELCPLIDLTSEFGKRCSQQIKTLKLSDDIEGYESDDDRDH